jgi:hypothetical protein
VYNPDRVKPHEELLYRVNIELKELGKVNPENSNPEMVSESIFDLANMVHDLCDQKYSYFMPRIPEASCSSTKPFCKSSCICCNLDSSIPRNLQTKLDSVIIWLSCGFSISVVIS